MEVAKACLYLATDATYSTGQNIYVSGGDRYLIRCFTSCQIFLFQYMGRLAEPVEVAKACLYLATDATYSTGQNIYVSGGTELDYGFKSQMEFFFKP